MDSPAFDGPRPGGRTNHTLPEPIQLPSRSKDGGVADDTIRVEVLLAQFSDLKFKYPRENFVNLINKKGYSYNGASGSVSDYFYSQMGDVYPIVFHVGPVVTMDRGYAYYGENDSKGSDLRPEQMIVEACRKSDSEVDFSNCDVVFVYYAGGNEADGSADSDHVWPHCWDIRYGGCTLTLDGKQIGPYSCAAELEDASNAYEKDIQFATIGTFCHEFAHLLGLYDMYDTDYEKQGSTMSPGPLSLMSNGNYSNNGRTPPNFTAFERLQLGLVKPTVLEEGPHTLEVGDVLIRESGTPGEYYLLEYRKATSWDAYIGGSGLVIYHVDYTEAVSDRWTENLVNAVSKHPCMAIVPPVKDVAMVDNSPKNWYAHPFWPYRTWNAFSATTDPPFSYWYGEDDELSLKNITLGSSSVSFDVAGHIYLDSKEIFPDAVVLSWTLEGCNGYSFDASLLKDGEEVSRKSIGVISDNSFATVFENLEPETKYTLKIKVEGEFSYSYSAELETVSYPKVPYIVIGDISTSVGGEFRSGQKIPLRIMPEKAVSTIEWTLDGSEISVSSDGYYTLEKSGLLKARVSYKDGTSGVFAKRMSVK